MGIKGLENLKPDDLSRKESEGLPKGTLILFDKENHRTEHPLQRDSLGRPLIPEKDHFIYIGRVTYQVTSVVWDFNKHEIFVAAEFKYTDG